MRIGTTTGSSTGELGFDPLLDGGSSVHHIAQTGSRLFPLAIIERRGLSPGVKRPVCGANYSSPFISK